MRRTRRARTRAFIALLLIGLVGCSTSGSTPVPATSSTRYETPASSTPNGTPAETSRSGTAGPLRWEQVVVSEEDWTVAALAVGEDRVLALVSGELSSVWASADGHEWRQVHEFAADEYPADIASTVDGYVVVGFVGEDRTQRVMVGTPAVPTVWTSADGATWERESVVLEAAMSFEDVAVGTDGWLVAIGSCIDPKPSQSQRLCGCYWVKDGTWVPADTTQTEGGMVLDLTVGGPGFVAVGQLQIVGQQGEGGVWTSVYGHTWERAPDDGAFVGAMLSGVAADGADIVVVGTQFDDPSGSPAAAWHSEDGQSWAPMTMGDDLNGTESAAGWMLNAVARLADGTLVAAGVAVSAGPDPATTSEIDVLLAMSSDSSTWVRVPDVTNPKQSADITGDFGLKTVVAMGDGAIVGGADQGAVVWIGEPDPAVRMRSQGPVTSRQAPTRTLPQPVCRSRSAATAP